MEEQKVVMDQTRTVTVELPQAPAFTDEDKEETRKVSKRKSKVFKTSKASKIAKVSPVKVEINLGRFTIIFFPHGN